MNVSEITDLQQLKALAYDQLVLQEQVQRNLALISARIAELERPPSTPPPGNPAKSEQ